MKRLTKAQNGVFKYQLGAVRGWGCDYVDSAGKRRRKLGFTTRQTAFQFSIAQRIADGGRRTTEVTLGQLANLWTKTSEDKRHGARSRLYVARWVEALGRNCKVQEIQTAEILDILDRWTRESRWTGATRNRAASQLAAMLSEALRRDWITAHPMRGKVERCKETGRERWLRPREIAKLKANSPPWLADIITVATQTLLRRQSILNLRATDFVDLGDGRGILTVQRTKNGEPITKPVQGELYQLIKRKAAGATRPDAYLLPGPRGGHAEGSLKREFPKAVRAAGFPAGRGINEVCFHSLRHSGASNAISAGVPLKAVKAMGGWRSMAMVERYAKLADETLWEAEKLLEQTLSPETAA